MNCPYCNADGKSDKFHHSCCKATGQMTFQRYLQMQFGDVMLSMLPPVEYEQHLLYTYDNETRKHAQPKDIKFEPFDHANNDLGEGYDYFDRNMRVLAHYCNQLTEEDCKIMDI